MKIRSFLLLAVLVWLSGCASQDTQTNVAPTGSNAEGPQKFRLLFTAHRYLNLEPCGCSFKPLGGLDREWNATNGMKKDGFETIKLTAGTTFVPSSESFKPKQVSNYAKKAQFMADGLKEMGVEIVSPGSEDLVLGAEVLKELENRSQIPFVSANLQSKKNGQLIFKPSVTITRGEKTFFVTGVSAAPAKAYASSEVTVRNPKESLKKVVASAPPDAMVIVLSNLATKDRESLLASVPKINLVLGGLPENSTNEVEFVNEMTLYANPLDRGRGFARLDLQWDGPFDGFYNEATSIAYAEVRALWQKKVNELQAEMGQKKKSQSWSSLNAEKQKYLGFLKKTAKIPLAYSPGLIRVESDLTMLDEKFDAPKNPMSALIERYKDAVRTLALGEN